MHRTSIYKPSKGFGLREGMFMEHASETQNDCFKDQCKETQIHIHTKSSSHFE